MTKQEALNQLSGISEELKKINELSSLTSYDLVACAAKGASARGSELKGYLTGLYHKKLTAPETVELVQFLSEPSVYNTLDAVWQGEVTQYRKRLDTSLQVPEKLLQEYTMLCSNAEQLWFRTKRTGPYNELLDEIEQIATLKSEIASASAQPADAHAHPMDAVIHSTDEGMTVQILDKLFEDIRSTTLPLLLQIREKPASNTASRIALPLSIAKQQELCVKLADRMGYSSGYGVIGVAEHPCTYGINTKDVRFTNHFYPDNMMPALISTTHEGGHGIYEMNVSPEYRNLLIGSPISGSIHESSSRLWEILIGHSNAFCEFLYDFLSKEIPDVIKGLSPSDFYLGMNTVTQEPLRIHSDELTYNLHIMLRYEVEKLIFEGQIKGRDIPEVWNVLSQKYLGFTPDSDALGWAQDMHWPAGLFGYFQSYTLGNLYSNQVYAKLSETMPNLSSLIRQGDFAPILGWLTDNWYRYGRTYSGIQLMEKITGQTLSASALCNHLTKKYSEIYSLS